MNYCAYAMFGGETWTTLVMLIALAAIAFFVAWISILAAENNGKITNVESNNNKKMKTDTNWFLGGSILIAAIIASTAMIYSAKLSIGGAAAENLNSAPAVENQTAAPAAPAQRSSGCGV